MTCRRYGTTPTRRCTRTWPSTLGWASRRPGADSTGATGAFSCASGFADGASGWFAAGPIPIHPTSGKWNSANYFAFRGFSKVRRAPILCLAPHCLDYAPGRTLRRDYRDLVEPGRTQQLPVLLAGALLPATEKHQHVEVHQGETRPLGRIRVVLRGEYLLDHPQPRARRHRPVAGG